MDLSKWLKRFWPIFVSILILGVMQSSESKAFAKEINYPAPRSVVLQPIIIRSSKNDLSPELKNIQLQRDVQIEITRDFPFLPLPEAFLSEAAPTTDIASVQDEIISLSPMPSPSLNFDGISGLFRGWPPDTQGDIGLYHYVQWINLHFAVWEIDRVNQNATLVYGPVAGNTLFSGFGGACEQTNDGDPITLYDPFADRWFMSQFALPNFPYGPFFQCVAVSQTGDPTGAWYRYEFQIPVNKMNDYPKFGIWQDAFYMSVNQYEAGTLNWGGAGVAALERSEMLQGRPASMVYFDLEAVNPFYGGILPADFDGTIPPPPGAPGYFLSWDNGGTIETNDALHLWEFRVDWANLSNSSFGLLGVHNQSVPTIGVDPNLCNYSRSCIPQPGTGNRLDAISDRLMYRLQYRNFGAFETLVSNHTVDVEGTDHAGIHWFELHKSAGSWSMYQEGVYAPDANHRWMGSVALDHVGNMALGYSVSSSNIYPSVRYAGRLANDPLNLLPQEEQNLIHGSGSQTGSSRWGDYSMMAVDPSDDCTFWYTQEYVEVSGPNSWKTRIAAFRFPECSVGPHGTLEGEVTDLLSAQPIQGAIIRMLQGNTLSFYTLTNRDGNYSMSVAPGIYDIEVAAFGYLTDTVTGVEILTDTVTTQDFSLQPSQYYTVSGTISDGATGWPLYAQIAIRDAPVEPIWSDPVTGEYSISLPENLPYTFNVVAFNSGYVPSDLTVGPLTGDLVADFALEIDRIACNAPGYRLEILPAYQSDFEADGGGFSLNGLTSWSWGVPTSGPSAAHSGGSVWATSLAGNYWNGEDGSITSPVVDLSTYPNKIPVLRWWQWLQTEEGWDHASVQVSADGGATWTTAYGPVSGDIDLNWQENQLTFDDSLSVADFRIRFLFTSDYSITFPGWYIDDVVVGMGECIPQPGSLIVGNVYDANTGAELVGAEVESVGGGRILSQATPFDLNNPDGFYSLFAPVGSQTLTVTNTGGFGAQVETLDVPLATTLRKDFYLPAGLLSYEPERLDIFLELGDNLTAPLTLINAGGMETSFSLIELDKGVVPLGPFEEPEFLVKPFKQDLPTSLGLGIPQLPAAEPLVEGEVLQSWRPVEPLELWGIVFDGRTDNVWISSPSKVWGGVDALFEYTLEGTPTDHSHPHASVHSAGPADMAYNWNTGTMWIMNVNTGIANCIYEIDPDTGYTGNRICPGQEIGFEISQRGLAYDPSTDTWFAGGWNDLTIYRFDSAGNILSRVATGLPISGLAYNPQTSHLFVMVNGDPNLVYVLDAENGYARLGQFNVDEGFGSNSGAGLEIDCDGNLWAVDQTTDTVYQFSSGETANLCNRDIAWLAPSIITGTIGGTSEQLLSIDFNAGEPAIDQPGEYRAQLKIQEDTPYFVPNLPITMTVTAPTLWGKINGIVTHLGYCDMAAQPLENATVTIESSSGISWTIQTDDDGYYQRWVDGTLGTFTVTITSEGYSLGLVENISVLAGETVNQDFELHWLQPCVQVDPSEIHQSNKQGTLESVSLSIRNSGHAITAFEFQEEDLDHGGNDVIWLSTSPQTGSLSPQEVLSVVVVLDASRTGIEQPGEYHAILRLLSEDPVNDPITIPVTMTVVPLAYGVEISEDISSHDIPGEVVTYTLTVTNTSEGPTDSFMLTLGSHDWPIRLGNNPLGPLAVRESTEVDVAVTIPRSAVGEETDVVIVTATSFGDPSKNDTVSITTTADTASADLEVTQIASQDPVVVGSVLSYTITVKNYGPTKATGITLMDALPAGVTFISTDGSCEIARNVLVCLLGKMLSGTETTIHVMVRPLILDPLLNQVVVISEQEDPQWENNRSETRVEVEGYLYYLPITAKD